eukprot:g16867.t1
MDFAEITIVEVYRMADEPPTPEEPEQPRQEDPEVKTLAENLGNLPIGRITLGNIPKELGVMLTKGWRSSS